MDTKSRIPNNFKPSPLGPIPEEWEVVRLGGVAQIRNGSRPIFRENGKIPVYGANGIMGWTDKHNVTGSLTLVIGRVGASGEVHLAKGNIWVSDNALFLILNHSEVSSEFLYYMLLKKNLKNLAAQSTHPIITQTTLKNLQIPLPPLPEQKRIAEVLLTVDLAIEKVEKEIEHTERLKRGLMQHLLTRGIGHTRFKDSPLGFIPEDWEVVRLGELVLKMFGGGTPSTAKGDYWNGDIPWMTSAHISGMFITDGQRYISQEGLKNSPTNLVPKGNLIIATRVGIGKVAVNLIDIAISQDLTGIIIDKDRALPEYLYWFLSFHHLGLKKFAQGSTIKGVLRSALANLKIPLPPLPEQKKIAEILRTVDRKLELLREKKERLEKVKKGLMNDLLTGRRRLKV